MRVHVRNRVLGMVACKGAAIDRQWWYCTMLSLLCMCITSLYYVWCCRCCCCQDAVAAYEAKYNRLKTRYRELTEAHREEVDGLHEEIAGLQERLVDLEAAAAQLEEARCVGRMHSLFTCHLASQQGSYTSWLVTYSTCSL